MTCTVLPVNLLTPNELPEAAALEAAHFPAPWTPAQFQSGHDQGLVRVHGIRHNTGLIGYVSCLILAPEMEILNMAVQPDFRRHGLGGALVKGALEHGWSLGVTLCHLEVDETNAPAVALYRSLGFVPTGRRPGYYRHPAGLRDAILMRRSLISPGVQACCDAAPAREGLP